MFGRPLALTLALGLASLVPGCFLDGTAFQAAGGGGGGADAPAGGGGEGGATHGTTSAGGAATSSTTGDTGSTGTASTTDSTTTGSTTSSTTTTTTTQPCTYDFDCPDPDPLNICLEAACASGVCTAKTAYEGALCGAASECSGYPTCQSGQCKAEPLPYGEALFDFNTKDCQKPICDGNGNAIHVADDSQVPDATECATKACDSGLVKTEPKASATSCGFGLGKCCSGHCCDPITCLACVD